MTARRLLRLDVPRGERVLDLLPTLAAALAGEGPALLPLDPADPRADAIAAALGADAPGAGTTAGAATVGSVAAGSVAADDAAAGAVTTSGVPAGSVAAGAATADAVTAVSVTAVSVTVGRPLEDGEDDPADPTALVMPTSGSTGAPKGVLLSAGQLAASAAATEARLGGPGSWLLALPAHHIAGMQVLLRAARAGTVVVALDGERPFTAADFVQRAETLPGPRRYVSLVPTQLRRILADPEATERTAALFDAVLVGGSATPPRLLAEARAAGIRAVTTYGMTETCGGCVYDGIPLDGVSARLTAAGAIALTGPMVARGYRGQPAHPAFPGLPGAPRTFITSDTGEIGSGGALQVHGRLDDVIVTGGLNVAPAAVEAAIRELPGIADVLVVGAPSTEWGAEVVALVVPAPGRPSWEVTALRQALAAGGELPAAHRPHRVIPVEAIPLLASGKPDRSAGSALAAPAD